MSPRTKNTKPPVLKLIEKGYYGDGNKYSYGDTTFIVSRYESFSVFDKAKGINAGKAVFSIYGHVNFHYGMREFKKFLINSEYNKKS